MARVKAAALLAVVIVTWSIPTLARAQGAASRQTAGPIAMTQAQPPADDFVPVTQLPETEQLPAAPLLIGAYVVVWLVLLIYLLSLWRRMAAVDRELADVERRLAGERRT